jgi:hypothetical protein
LYAYVCVCAFSLRRESPNMILGDKPLISEVVLSQRPNLACEESMKRDLKDWCITKELALDRR